MKIQNCKSTINPRDTSCNAKSFTDDTTPLSRFQRMIPNALEYAREAKKNGKKIAGIFCEYTPRELFFAADMLPICMCGGQESTIPEAEKELPSNLCPLIKSSYGHALKHSNPFMEMADLLVAETTCDGKKKMYELLSRNRSVHILELPQKPEEESALRHWLEEIQLLKKRIEEITGRIIDDESLLNATQKMNEERDLRREIAYLAASDPPMLSGMEILSAKSSLSLIPGDLAAYRQILTWAKDRPSPYSGKLRILMTGVPHPHGAEKVMALVEECGAVVVAQENCTGLKPILENPVLNGDPLRSLARKYLDMPCPCMTPNHRRLEYLDQLIPDFRPTGVIELIWTACHTFNIESEKIRRHVQDHWELPYLKLETDYSPSDRAQLRVRIEAFLELCRSRKG